MKKSYITLVALLMLAAGWIYSHMEVYCTFWPSIDTKYSEGYSEVNFNKIEKGMTMEEVIKIMDKPLIAERRNKKKIEYMYSSDGRCVFGDFAWLNRSVAFEENKVTEIYKSICYD